MPSDALVDLLTLQDLGGGRFEAPPPAPFEGGHVFGGYVAAQGLRSAASTTAPDRRPHSVHAYFVSAGTVGRPIGLSVETVRDGRSFSLRRVTASQEGEVILILDASFQVDQPGRMWSVAAPPDVSPDDCIDRVTYLHDRDWLEPFEIRPVLDAAPAAHPFWVRTRVPLPADPALHASVILAIADIGVATSAVGPRPFGGRIGPSLDHCVWLHRPPSADDWLYFSLSSQANGGGRGFGTGTIITATGDLVATVAQEILMRESL